MRVLRLKGSHRDMGRQLGSELREQTQSFYAIRLQIAIDQAWKYGGRRVDEAEVLKAARSCLPVTRAYDPKGFEELQGIAEGSGLSMEQVLALNGLTDLRDWLAWGGDEDSLGGCSAFVVQKDATQDGAMICGQTWDLATNNMPYVIGVHRQPDTGPQTWTLTTAGCLSLIGMNEDGLCVGTTNVRVTDAGSGVVYLSIIHKALSAGSHSEAVACVTDARRVSGHFYYIASADGQATALECTGTRVHQTQVEQGVYVHCNHCLIPENAELEGNKPTASSLERTSRLDRLFVDNGTQNNLDSAKTFLANTEGGLTAICRDDTEGVSSNGAVVMSPSRGEIQACHGLPSTAPWVHLNR
jgi:isopenicillin-N N-acyltransferase like protein